jgi:Glucose / Sorbosone dehydrogenase
MRAATLTASACGIAIAACLSACGNGSAPSAGSTSPPPAGQFLIAAMAPLPGGGFLWGNRVTGVIRRVNATGHATGGVVAQVAVATTNLHGLLGLARTPDGRVFAAWTDRADRLTVGQVSPGPIRVIWRALAFARFDVGGHLAVTPQGKLLLGVGAGVIPTTDAAAPTGDLVLLRPGQRPSQASLVLSTGWNNPFAFAYTPAGRLWVADNVPGTRGERLARGDLDGRPTHVTPLPPGTAPSGLAAVSDSRLVLCGFQSHLLQPFRIAPGQRAVATGAPIARNCWIGVIRLADGRLAYAGTGATVTIISPSGADAETLHL